MYSLIEEKRVHANSKPCIGGKVLGSMLRLKEEKVKQVNNYVLGTTIGSGSFGKVKIALDTKNLAVVAIKILKKGKSASQETVEDVKAEIRALSMLEHSNIVELIEVLFSRKEKKLYIVYEKCFGGNIRKLVKAAPNGRLKEEVAQHYFSQLIDALEYIHSKGIVHGDLKPDNLLTSASGNLKIADFGVAQIFDTFTKDMYKPCKGCVAFLPPEAFKSTEVPGFQMDIWAAGVCLYFMVAGELPFNKDDGINALFNSISECDFTIPEYLSGGVKDLLSRILVKEPDQRLDIEGIKHHEWVVGAHTHGNSLFYSVPCSSRGRKHSIGRRRSGCESPMLVHAAPEDEKFCSASNELFNIIGRLYSDSASLKKRKYTVLYSRKSAKCLGHAFLE